MRAVGCPVGEKRFTTPVGAMGVTEGSSVAASEAVRDTTTHS